MWRCELNDVSFHGLFNERGETDNCASSLAWMFLVHSCHIDDFFFFEISIAGCTADRTELRVDRRAKVSDSMGLLRIASRILIHVI